MESIHIWVFPKNRGKPPKMDGENKGKLYFLMDDLGGKNHPLFLVQHLYPSTLHPAPQFPDPT